MTAFIRKRRWDRLGTASAISLPILFALSADAGLLDLLASW